MSVPAAVRRRWGLTEGGRVTVIAMALARRQLGRFHQLDLDRELLDRAAGLSPGMPLRSLDAIHLAAAQTLADLRAVLTYDTRMAAAAEALGLPVEAPA